MKLLFFWCMFLSITCINGSRRSFVSHLGSAAKQALQCKLTRDMDLEVNEILVYFYPQYQESKLFLVNKAATEILSLPNLNKNKKLFVYIGGFTSHVDKKSTELVRNALKNIKNSYLIFIDHSPYTNDKDGYMNSYDRSVKFVPYIGRKVAEMLASLTKGGYPAKNIHCIGHSLGGQILGHVGENFIKLTGQKISRLTALDPAGPCFDSKPINEQIRSGVAEYVEIYHCNADELGSSKTLGDVDFFLNDGQTQPNCKSTITDPLQATTCSHKACVMMWMASVTHPDWFPAYKCSDYKEYKSGKCFKHQKASGGFWNDGKAFGIYYLSTTDKQF